MKTKVVVTTALIAYAVGAVLPVLAAGSRYNHQLFVDALMHDGYVLVNVRGCSGSDLRTVCVPAKLFLGAIHLQYELDYDQAGNNRTMQLASTSKNRTFSFTKPDACKNIEPEYTPEQLNQVRTRLAKLTRTQMEQQLEQAHSELHGIYATPGHQVYHDAVAHVLLENGIAVGADDRTDMLMPLHQLD
jgi:hypothetical protein